MQIVRFLLGPIIFVAKSLRKAPHRRSLIIGFKTSCEPPLVARAAADLAPLAHHR